MVFRPCDASGAALSASELGVFGIEVAAGIGTVIVGLTVGYLSRMLSDLAWFRICTFAYGLLVIGYGIAQSIPMLIALQFLMNCLGVRLMASTETLFLTITPNRMLGKVGSAVSAIERGIYLLLNLVVVQMTGIIEFQVVLVAFSSVGAAVALAACLLLTTRRLAEPDRERDGVEAGFAVVAKP